jgi:hypothetical protein
MTTETGFTPNELELMIKRELRNSQDLPEALLVQIFSDRDSWRAEARFKPGYLVTNKSEIAKSVAAIGAQLASTHRLVG